MPEHSPTGTPDAKTILAFLTVVLFLGSNFVAVRFSNHELAPFWGAGLRFLIAAGILISICWARGLPMPKGRALVGAALFGTLAFGANFALLYWALVRVPSGVASVAFATIPLSTFFVAVAVGLERFHWHRLFGAVIVIGGMLAIARDSLAAHLPIAGLVAVVLASLAAALSGIVVKAFPKSHPFATNAVAMTVGCLLLLAASILRGEPWIIPSGAATGLAVTWLVASSIVAFGLMVWLLTRWTATANSYGSVLAPLVTIPVAAWLNHEAPRPVFLGAAVLVLWGVYVGTFYRPRRDTPPVVAVADPKTAQT